MPDGMWPCPSCPKTFSTFEEVEAHKKAHSGEVRVTKAADVVPAPKAQKPTTIDLTYKFTGNCPDCRTPVETIELDVQKKSHIVVAWCQSCRVQLQQRVVEKL